MLKEDLDLVYGIDKCYFERALFDNLRENEARVAEEILAEAKDTEDFINKYLEDERVKNFYARNILARIYKPDIYWKTIREFVGDRQFKTSSDAGSVKIGNETFSVLIPNGRGDGITRVAVVEDEPEFNSLDMKFFTSVSGEFSIYDYDCGDRVVMTLDGRYFVYYYDGFVVFAKEQ